MKSLYNRIAGQSLERLSALSDGVFSIAMTLLVLDIKLPSVETIRSEHELGQALVALAPRFVMYGMSFLTLGIFWVGQQTQLNHFSRSTRDLAWLHILFLSAVAILPFSTTLLAEFITYRTALLVYWVNVLMMGVFLYLGWRYASRAGLVKDEPTDGSLSRAVERRIVIAQALYALGAALCVINTFWSIGFIVLVQINYAVAPRLRPLAGR